MGLLAQTTLKKIRAEIAYYPHARGALLYALHAAREDVGALSREVYAELALLFEMPVGEMAEVASFYSLFTQPRAKAVFQVCTNLSCCLRGAREIARTLEHRLGIKPGSATPDGKFALCEVECLGSCSSAPVVQVNRNPYLENVTPEFIASLTESPERALEAKQPAPIASTIPEGVEGYLLPSNGQRWLTVDDYRRNGGYQSILKAATMAPKEIAELVKTAGLRGRGGAGFATGLKWTFMPPRDERPRYLAVNGDESEPGTFKDREIMQRNPHQILEGIMISSLAIEANAAFIYVRGEYVEPYRIVRKAIEDAYAANILGENALGFNRRFDIHIQPGAGAYICGEETGMLQSMEGKKGQPRKRPPFPAQFGLWGKPTTVDNIETVSHVPAIVAHGAEWFQRQGAPKSGGHTLFGVSGHVKRPGIFELPLGVNMRDVIYRYAGGLEDGRTVKAVIPGGVSMPVVRGDQIDVAMDHESLKSVNTLLGTAGVIVLDDRSCMVRAAMVVAHFFRYETCGQCTQCREGTGWIYKMLARIEAGKGHRQDLEALADCTRFMEAKCICALADGAAWAAGAFLRQFRSEFESHIEAGRCPFEESFEA